MCLGNANRSKDMIVGDKVEGWSSGVEEDEVIWGRYSKLSK